MEPVLHAAARAFPHLTHLLLHLLSLTNGRIALEGWQRLTEVTLDLSHHCTTEDPSWISPFRETLEAMAAHHLPPRLRSVFIHLPPLDVVFREQAAAVCASLSRRTVTTDWHCCSG